MPILEIKNICKRYPNGYLAVNDVSFSVEKGEYLTLRGPSGSGKTTLLRIIAGLEKQDSGHVIMDGQNIDHVPPEERNVGMLFQNYAIYESRTVFENLALGLRLRNIPKGEADFRVMKMARTLGMENLLRKKARDLGEEDRVRLGIGRAVIFHPDIVLVDSIFQKMARDRRQKMQRELYRIHGVTGTTVICANDEWEETGNYGRRAVISPNGGKDNDKTL